MREVVLALLAGIIVGLIFKLIKLPLPAPPVLAGVMGIVGVYFGGLLADRILAFFQ
jgi:XapX domain-containing protein